MFRKNQSHLLSECNLSAEFFVMSYTDVDITQVRWKTWSRQNCHCFLIHCARNLGVSVWFEDAMLKYLALFFTRHGVKYVCIVHKPFNNTKCMGLMHCKPFTVISVHLGLL